MGVIDEKYLGFIANCRHNLKGYTLISGQNFFLAEHYLHVIMSLKLMII
jgi:hypothetical protein